MSTPRVERQDTPAQRSTRAKRAALARHAFERGDPMIVARDKKSELFERAVDPDEQLAPEERATRGRRLFRAWMTDLNYQSSRKRRGQPYRVLNLRAWLEAAQKKSAPPASIEGTDSEVRDAATSPTP